jgi:hypothetical protein
MTHCLRCGFAIAGIDETPTYGGNFCSCDIPYLTLTSGPVSRVEPPKKIGKVTIEDGKFTVNFVSGKVIELTQEEWMELREMQNILIQTEPE